MPKEGAAAAPAAAARSRAAPRLPTTRPRPVRRMTRPRRDAAGGRQGSGADREPRGRRCTTKTGGRRGDRAKVAKLDQLAWQDIVVVQRKDFLKAARLELAPFTGTVDQRQPHSPLRVRPGHQLLSQRRVLGRRAGPVLHQGSQRARGSDRAAVQPHPDLNHYLYSGGAQLRLRAGVRKVRASQQEHRAIGRSSRRAASAGSAPRSSRATRASCRGPTTWWRSTSALGQPVLPVRLDDRELRSSATTSWPTSSSRPTRMPGDALGDGDAGLGNADSQLVNNVMALRGRRDLSADDIPVQGAEVACDAIIANGQLAREKVSP